ncbi:MAG: 1-deoxy-D-xylulose-5-phosphate reductoisomerase [Chloroflexota bacterium]
MTDRLARAPKRIAIVGSTGSVGRQALDVISWHPESFSVGALASRSDSAAFRSQVAQWRPPIAVVAAAEDTGWAPAGTQLLVGASALVDVASRDDLDLVLLASTGIAGLAPTLAAVRAGRSVAVANKETLVTGGSLVMSAARASGAQVLPVDSEHSAIWQCLIGEPQRAVKRITLTASGGAFRDVPLETLRNVSPEQALHHPNWRMGKKITVDSATLMNKGLEVLEASCLFGVPLDDLDILIHRESIVHSMVEFTDGSVKAQLGVPDMRLPIQYALSYPERLSTRVPPLNLAELRSLTFECVDPVRFRCAFLAIEAGRVGQSMPVVLNAADEVAVELFLAGAIRFDQIGDLVATALDRHVPVRDLDLEAIYEIDRWTRELSLSLATSSV